jgi:hypothetical protein
MPPYPRPCPPVKGRQIQWNCPGAAAHLHSSPRALATLPLPLHQSPPRGAGAEAPILERSKALGVYHHLAMDMRKPSKCSSGLKMQCDGGHRPGRDFVIGAIQHGVLVFDRGFGRSREGVWRSTEQELALTIPTNKHIPCQIGSTYPTASHQLRTV